MHVIQHLVCVSRICLLISLHIFSQESHSECSANDKKSTSVGWWNERRGERIGISCDGHIPLVKGKRSECRQDREMGLWQGRWRGDVTPGTSNPAVTDGDGCSNSSHVTRTHTNVYTLLSSSKKCQEGEVWDVFMWAVLLWQCYLLQQQIVWQNLMQHTDKSLPISVQ